MTACGTKRTCQSCRSMSAFGGKADKVHAGRDVCFEIPQRSSLLPHRVPTRAGSAQRPASIQNNSVRPHQMRQQQH